jgi:hypothetical protein
MSGRMSRLTVIVGVLVALTLAGAAGAIVRYTIFTITPGNFARLSGTNLYCKNGRSTTHRRVFLCALYGGPGTLVVRGTYGFAIDQTGIVVERWGSPPDYKVIRSFSNPLTPGG